MWESLSLYHPADYRETNFSCGCMKTLPCISFSPHYQSNVPTYTSNPTSNTFTGFTELYIGRHIWVHSNLTEGIKVYVLLLNPTLQALPIGLQIPSAKVCIFKIILYKTFDVGSNSFENNVHKTDFKIIFLFETSKLFIPCTAQTPSKTPLYVSWASGYYDTDTDLMYYLRILQTMDTDDGHGHEPKGWAGGIERKRTAQTIPLNGSGVIITVDNVVTSTGRNVHSHLWRTIGAISFCNFSFGGSIDKIVPEVFRHVARHGLVVGCRCLRTTYWSLTLDDWPGMWFWNVGRQLPA